MVEFLEWLGMVIVKTYITCSMCKYFIDTRMAQIEMEER